MGITHELDIFLVSEDIAMKHVELHKGNSYGCVLNIKSSCRKQMKIIFVLKPDWTEIDSIKPIQMEADGIYIDVTIIKQSFYEVIYCSNFTIYGDSVINIFSDIDRCTKEKYPIININIDKKKYEIIESGYTYIYIQSPIDKEDKLTYMRDDYVDEYNSSDDDCIDYYDCDYDDDDNNDAEDEDEE
ncbi:SPV064 putative host range protein [Swinepox virus]|uniref:Probable host range protein 2 n=2 Tax=Swinepox virus TaxID=10276 RepID=VHR2_SWPVK|nr:putative host range protein [Swinepox virus]P23333.1 RecName: Full=Probable host range protein 2 [Swinepox virus (STRAIN KASZA)]AAA47892.1 SwF8a [Swinepox virus]AAL69803.1 SPV064 putative host range protein [Swinepox virus]UED36629.1 putative host range protein [Swinepox virus]UUA44254.1 SPV064 [Swinepox virus]